MSENSQINWKIYEEITSYIYESLGAQDGIKVIGFGRENNLEGKSGIEHQIDVLTEELQKDQRLRTAIECKYWNKKVNKDVVMKLSEIMSDLDIANGIIVCKSGFTRDTVKYAQHKGIRLVKLWETGEKDAEHLKEVELGTIQLYIHGSHTRPNITSIGFGSKIIHFDPSLGDVYYWNLYDASGKEFPLKPILFEFGKKIINQGVTMKSKTIDYELSGSLFLRINNEQTEVNKISVTGFLSVEDQNRVISLALTDQVWLIMEELFEGRRLTMSKTGLIWNLPKNDN